LGCYKSKISTKEWNVINFLINSYKLKVYINSSIKLYKKKKGRNIIMIIKNNHIDSFWINYFNYDLPDIFLDLEFLQYLRLSSSFHKFPASFFKMKQLKTLILDFNGRPSNFDDLQQLVNLKKIKFYCYEFPYWIIKLKELESIKMTSFIEIKLPEFIKTLESLKRIQIWYSTSEENSFVPYTFDPIIGNLNQLESLSFGADLLTKTIYEDSLFNCRNLKELSFYRIKLFHHSLDNSTKGKIPLNIFKLKHLRKLIFNGCEIREIPKEILQLKKLEVLNLYANNLKEIPNFLFQLCNLEELYLTYTFCSTLPDSLCLIPQLKILYLSNNPLWYLPKDLGKLKKLEELYVDNNRLEDLPDSICEITTLKKIDTTHNEIRYLPEHIGNLKNLEILRIPYNKIIDLPISIGRCAKLWKLILWGNPLEELPNSLLECESLKIIKISLNQIQNLSQHSQEILQQLEKRNHVRIITKINYTQRKHPSFLSNPND